MTSTFARFALAGAVTAFAAGQVLADQMDVRGVVRDFTATHSDFQSVPSPGGPIQGMVKEELDADFKPVLNVADMGFYRVDVEASAYDLSNVVLQLAEEMDAEREDSIEYKYDIEGTGYHETEDGGRYWVDPDNPKSGTFWVPDEYVGQEFGTIAVWVKSGPNFEDDSDLDGPGYGTYVANPSEEQKDETHSVEAEETFDDDGNHENIITVTFHYDHPPCPLDWGIANKESFREWFRNKPVNMSTFSPIRLDNGKRRPGGLYTGTERPFLPVNGQLFGEGEADDNHHFTYELATRFWFSPRGQRNEDLYLRFSGNDDLWVFINGRLVIDLGGVRESEAWAEINIDQDLDLQPDRNHTLHVFYANRYEHQPNLSVQTNLPLPSATAD